MIDLALDPSETRTSRSLDATPARRLNPRMLLLGLAAAGGLCGFGVAASTLMAGLVAPAPVRLAAPSRAAEWPDLKDGLPAVAAAKPAAVAEPAAPAVPVPRMAALPEPAAAVQMPAASPPPRPAPATAAAPEPPTKRIPNPTPVDLIGPARQAVPLAPTRTAALLQPRGSETVHARNAVEPAAPVPTPAAATPVPAASAAPEKPVRKVAARRQPAPAKAADKAPAAVAEAQPPQAEETEVLGIKLPSLAPAGRKLKESVDALGEAVRNVF